MIPSDRLRAAAPGEPVTRVPGSGAVLSSVDETAFVARLRAGDAAAYETLVRMYGPPLLAAARRILRSEAEAQDVLQDAFIAAFKSIARFAGDARLSTWLHRIVINTSLMRIRSRTRRPETPIDDLLPRFDSTEHQTPPSGAWAISAESALLQRETREIVRDAIDTLPENYRTVLVLRDIEELSTAEVAAMLGLTLMAVKVRLHRARQALRTRLAPTFETPWPADQPWPPLADPVAGDHPATML